MTTTTHISSDEQLSIAEKQRKRYPSSVLSMMNHSDLVALATDVLTMDVRGCTNKGAVLVRINNYLNTAIGLAKYRIQQENRGATQPMAPLTQAPVISEPIVLSTRMSEDMLEALATKLQNVSGRHTGIYQHIATKVLHYTHDARTSHIDVVAYVILALKMEACYVQSQDLRLCILRVISLIEGK